MSISQKSWTPLCLKEISISFKNINGLEVFQGIQLVIKEILLKNRLLIQEKINWTYGLDLPHLFLFPASNQEGLACPIALLF